MPGYSSPGELPKTMMKHGKMFIDVTEDDEGFHTEVGSRNFNPDMLWAGLKSLLHYTLMTAGKFTNPVIREKVSDAIKRCQENMTDVDRELKTFWEQNEGVRAIKPEGANGKDEKTSGGQQSKQDGA